MYRDKEREHAMKELIKFFIDANLNYTEKVKSDLKSIIDASRYPQEATLSIYTYLASMRMR